MAASLKHKTAGALLWNLIDRGGQQLLLFIVGILVANLLTVDDYALVGMLALFTAVATILLDSGFTTALIQRQHVTDVEYSSVFWFNLGISGVLYLVLLTVSPLVARFFGQPMLVPISFVIFLALPINALSLVQTAILNKEVRFKKLTKINLISMTVAGCSALLLAILGCGVWTLAWQPVILATVRAALLWRHTDWLPLRRFSREAIRSLFGYASSLLFASLINTCFLNVYSFIIGKLYPLHQLGYYTQGNKMCEMGVSMLYGSIQNATLPIFSSIQHERERLIRAYRKTIRFTAFVTFPLMSGLFAVAGPVIRLLLKEEWWPTIPFLQLLAVGGCFTILTAINNNFIKISGHTRGILQLEYYKIVFTVVVVLCTYRYGALTLVAGLVLTRLLVYIINTLYTWRLTGYTLWMQLCDIVPYLLLAAIMGTATLLLTRIIISDFWLLITQIVIGAAVYLGLAWLTGSKILKEAISLLTKNTSTDAE